MVPAGPQLGWPTTHRARLPTRPLPTPGRSCLPPLAPRAPHPPPWHPFGRNLGCSNFACNLCKLSQRRRCVANFSAKYLAPCDVLEAKCAAQIYVVVVAASSSDDDGGGGDGGGGGGGGTDDGARQLVQSGLDEMALLVREWGVV